MVVSFTFGKTGKSASVKATTFFDVILELRKRAIVVFYPDNYVKKYSNFLELSLRLHVFFTIKTQ
jgi:hypothetical protein